MSVTVIVPGWLPVAVGVKVTLMEQLAPAATEAPQVLVWPYCVLATMLVIFSALPPMLLNVTVCAALGVPTAWLPKARLEGEKFATGPDAGMPVPVRLITCEPPEALSVRVIAPVRVPVAVGVKVTLMVQPAPAATELPHVFVCAKSPLATTLAMLSVAVPVLFRVTVSAVLVEPTVVPPPPATNVAMTEVMASDAEAVAVAVCVPVAVTILSSEKASVPDTVFGDDRGSAYPVPVVHVPDPFCLAKSAMTYSFAEAVAAVVETVPAEALD